MGVLECVFLGLSKAHAHCDCCKAMHACVGVCVWACTRCMLTVIAARRCMFSVVCVFVPYETVCLVCALSLLFLKHQDSSIDDLMFDFMNFVLCRNSTGWIIVW
jgi:hypothetical protein